jgi:transcriptional regulator GlxA family with amidase domain
MPFLESSDSDAVQLPMGRGHTRARRLQAAQAFIHANLHREELDPGCTAAALGISIRQLHLLFEPTGTTFSRYLLTRRLERARGLLAASSSDRIIDIALSCGIKSSTVFYRGFRQAFGENPTEYRQSLRKRDQVL